jgi:glycosyltransferase involved in cell wall biosynthesis
MRILCVHQGFELYGSDRCFIDSMRTIRRTYPTASITVFIPCDGPIRKELEPVVDQLRFANLWVLRRQDIKRLFIRSLFGLPIALFRAIGGFRRNDLVYINTVTVLDYMLAARFFRRKALLHIHEAPEGFVGWVLASVVRHIGASTIFNSEATLRAYRPHRSRPSYVLYNGIDAPATSDVCSYDGTRRLRLLMLGRLSFGKGQDLLIDACRMLPKRVLDSIEIRIVGSSFGTEMRVEASLRAQAHRIEDPDVIRFEPFVDDPSELYRWCDLAVVPSRVREGFGRVAAEAMAHARASIIAADGGLTEIVMDQETGWWFAPADVQGLAHAITLAVDSPKKVRAFGSASRIRFNALFAQHIVDARLSRILHEVTSDRARGSATSDVLVWKETP